jgi:tubulin-specific chaperone B
LTRSTELSSQIKFEHATGIPVGNQRVLLFNAEKDSVPVAELAGDDEDLAFYALRDWQVLKVGKLFPLY